MHKLRTYILWLIPIGLASASFFLVVGPQSLNPKNLFWLQGGDTATHYLGWAFYRYSPWTFPIGLSPRYGLELSSSIVFPDSIPLLAILLKPFSAWLSEPFQYLGIWVLLCFLLQAIFAWKLSTLITQSIWSKMGITILFIFAPPFLSHYYYTTALVSHFLILAALYLCLRRQPTRAALWWTLLLCAAALIQFYLFASVAVLWLANVFDRWRSQLAPNALRRTCLEVLVVAAVVLVVLWQAGYFAISLGSGSPGGYGENAVNLVSIFDPSGWSYLYTRTPYDFHASDEMNYLGLGIICLLPFALYALLTQWQACVMRLKRHTFFLAGIFLLLIFSISNQIHIGDVNYVLPLPFWLSNALGTLRASARIFWAPFYFLIFSTCFLVCRFYGRRFALILLAIAIVLQVGDTSAGWLKRRKTFVALTITEADFHKTLVSPFWGQAAKRYTNIVKVFPSNASTGWELMAFYAQENRMSTNSVYMGRMDTAKLSQSKAHLLQVLSSGQYDPNTLYVLENDKVMPALENLKTKDDLFAYIDGLSVIAPGWLSCASCYSVPQEQWITQRIPYYQLGQTISFSRSAKNLLPYVLLRGWAYPEEWGIWSDGNQAQFSLVLPKGAQSLTLTARAFITPEHPTQSVEIIVNNQKNQDVVLSKPSGNVITIPINSANQALGYVNIELKPQHPLRPKDLGSGDDERRLGSGLEGGVFR